MKHATRSLLSPTSSTRLSSATVPKPVPVRFEFRDPTALSVAVAGTFNGWNPKKHILHHDGDGLWVHDTKLPPGQHEYCLVVDGRWMPDPEARESRPNPFGGRNSILSVPSSRNGVASAASIL